jgi:hypothetical protein
VIIFNPVELDDRWHFIPAHIQIGGNRGAIISVKSEQCDMFYGDDYCVCTMTDFTVDASMMKFDKYGIPYDPRNSWSE